MMNYSLLIDQDQDKDVLAVDTSNYSDVLHDQRSKNTKTRLHHSEKHIAHSFRGYDLENGRSIGADEGYREGVQFGRELYGRLFEDANTIEGGTTEVNKNVLGEQVLGLPREPDPYHGIAWKETPR